MLTGMPLRLAGAGLAGLVTAALLVAAPAFAGGGSGSVDCSQSTPQNPKPGCDTTARSGDDNGTTTGCKAGGQRAGAPPVVSPQVLARQARARLTLPDVAIRVNPSGDQLVGLPSWLSLDPASWRPQSATASVPGISVTATATPIQAVWSMGSGDSVVCHGPGTPWRPGTDPMAASPDCGYRYVRSSASAPGGAD